MNAVKSRILIYTEELFPDGGGIGRYTHTLANGLAEKDVCVCVVSPIVETKSSSIQRFYMLKEMGRKGLRQNPLALGRMFIGLLKEIRRFNAHALLSTSASAHVICAWLQPFIHVPIFLTFHGSEIERHLTNNALRYRIIRPFLRRLLVRSNSIMCVSEAVSKRLIAAGQHQGLNLSTNVITVYNGVESTFWKTPKDTVKVERIRSEWCRQVNHPWPETMEHIFLLTVARLDQRKDHEAVIQVLANLPPNVCYVIAGRGPLDAPLRSLAIRTGVADRVLFLEFVPEEDLLSTYDACDIFVMPSIEHDGRIEGFGLVLVEAMARGKAVIATRHGGIPEVICDGYSGLLIDMKDQISLLKAIKLLVEDPELRMRMGRQAKAWSFDRFESSVMTTSVLRILEEQIIRNHTSGEGIQDNGGLDADS